MSIPALKKIYQEKVVPELKKNLGIDNPHLVPNLEKIVVSSGIRSEMPKEWVQEVVKEDYGTAARRHEGQQEHREF